MVAATRVPSHVYGVGRLFSLPEQRVLGSCKMDNNEKHWGSVNLKKSVPLKVFFAQGKLCNLWIGEKWIESIVTMITFKRKKKSNNFMLWMILEIRSSILFGREVKKSRDKYLKIYRGN